MMTLKRLLEPEKARKNLENDRIASAHFLWHVFRQGSDPKVYSTLDNTCFLAVDEKERHLMFAGDWSEQEIPTEILPKEGAFVSASPPSAIERLKEHYALEGEWPCWHYLAPETFGPGEWDALEPLREDEVEYVASFWELGGDDREEHIRQSVKNFDSACIRLDSKPVAWCGLHFEIEGVGNLGFAHTLEEHRRKGYARDVTKALVNKLGAKGSRATADVIKDNVKSIAVCESMGFEVVGELTWADFSKNQ